LIISNRYGFAFVHIPKCAGSTVREQIERTDPARIELAGRRTHPVLGKIDAMHLPLDVLREHFPEIFAQLKATDSYALTREPHDRFRSAVSEYVKTYEGKRLSEFDAAELGRVLDDIMAAVAARPALLPLRYVHFTPQARYIHIDGAEIVSRRYALENIGAFFAELSSRTGAAFDPGSRANQDFAFRFKGFERWLWTANQALKTALPYPLYQGIKRHMKPLLVRNNPADVADVFASAGVRDFVADIYAADIALHAADRRAEPRAASKGARGR